MLLSHQAPISTAFVVTVALAVFYTFCRPEVGCAFLVHTPRIGLSEAVVPCALRGKRRDRMSCRKAPMVVVPPSEQGSIRSRIPHYATRRDTASDVQGRRRRNYTGQDGGKTVPKWRMKLKTVFKGLFMGYSEKDESVQFEYEKNMGRFTSDLDDDVLSNTLANARLNFDAKAKEGTIYNSDLLSEKDSNRAGTYATKFSVAHSHIHTKERIGEDSSAYCLSEERTPRHLSVVGGEFLDPTCDSTRREEYQNNAAVQRKVENRKFGNAADVAHLQRLFNQHVDDSDSAQ